MKVLITFNTLTPYMSAIFTRIANSGIDLVIALPRKKNSSTVGKGVKNVDGKFNFRVVLMEEIHAFYGKPKIKNLQEILIQEQPDILVSIWPYFLQLYFERSLLRYIKSKGIKLVFKEIPFQVPPFGEITYFRRHPVYDENMNLVSRGIFFYMRTVLIMFIRKYLYSKIDGTLNYISSAKNILMTYGISEQKIFVTYNSTDTDALLEQKKQVEKLPALLPHSLRILHIGRLVKWKRVDLLIDAFVLVLKKLNNVELLIIGDGPELESLKMQVYQLGIEKSVRFVGAVYDPLIIGQYMSVSSLYVLAGMGGLSINDAMTYTLPIICSVCDGTEKDLVQDGVNGFFFKEGDSEDLATKILFLLKNEKILCEFGKMSEKVILNNININSVSDRYITAFNKIYAV